MTADMTDAMTAAVISAAEVAAGHDGRAEILLQLTYPNGARTSVSLPAEACLDALDRAGVTEIGDLVGRAWYTAFTHLPFPDLQGASHA